MKNLKIVMIVFLSCFTLFLCSMLGIALASGSGSGWFLHNREGSSTPGRYSLVQEKEIPIADIEDVLKEIHIDFGMNSHDVYFYQGDSDALVIREYLNYTPDEGQLSIVALESKELVIRGKRQGFFSFSLFSFQSQDGYVEIYLPDLPEYALESLWVKTVSGQIRSEVPFPLQDRFQATSTSGDITFPTVMAGTFQATSTSGDIYFQSIEADTLSLTTTSGDILLEQTAGTVKCSTTSGEITLSKAKGDTTVSSTSGDMDLGTLEGQMSLSSTSGDISLQGGTGHLHASTVSGDVRSDYLDGDFQLNTTSGTLSLLDGKGCGKAGSVSGDIRICLQELNGDLAISTTSGYVDCKLPGDTSLSLEFKSVSGDCSTFFDEALSFNKKGNQAKGQYGSDPAWNMSVSTTSGDLRILEY